MVILPDHLHTIWHLPAGDADFSTRWRMIKRDFSIAMQGPQQASGKRTIWQRRFWDHAIRNEADWRQHIDYLHYNPVKHGYVSRPVAWPYSSFNYAVQRGWYAQDWGLQEPGVIRNMNLE